MEKEKHPDKSCWNCALHQAGGINLLGVCKYFETIGKEKKDIPQNIIDVGCRYFKESKPF